MLRGVATKAAKHALNGAPWTAEEIDLSVVVLWEKGRRLWDDDNLIAALKCVRDGIADALGVDDAKFRWVETHQEMTGDVNGVMMVTLEVRD